MHTRKQRMLRNVSHHQCVYVEERERDRERERKCAYVQVCATTNKIITIIITIIINTPVSVWESLSDISLGCLDLGV